jgi:pimeloyl-ACP methyl ester carboxylesterase
MATPKNSNSLYVQSIGPEEAPTIIFLPGGGAGGWMWRPVAEALSEYRCLLPDPPEYGGSREVKSYSIHGFASLIAGLIREQVRGERAHVVGLSEGAQVVVALMSKNPELVDHAVISSALLRPLPGMGWFSSPAMIRMLYRWSVEPFKNSDWWIRLNMKYAAGVPEKYYSQFKEDFQNNSEAAFTHLMLENQSFRLPPGLERATAPTLVVVGAKEYSAMRQSAHDLGAALPNAIGYTLSLGEKASLQQEHNWALHAPDLFAETTRAWIEGKALPPELHPI